VPILVLTIQPCSRSRDAGLSNTSRVAAVLSLDSCAASNRCREGRATAGPVIAAAAAAAGMTLRRVVVARGIVRAQCTRHPCGSAPPHHGGQRWYCPQARTWLKRQYDPTNLFRMNANITPAAG
jgi:hypothetical protein